MGVTIYYCVRALFKTEALNLSFCFSLGFFFFGGGNFFYFYFYFYFILFFNLDDQRSLQPGFLLYLFLVFVKFY